MAAVTKSRINYEINFLSRTARYVLLKFRSKLLCDLGVQRSYRKKLCFWNKVIVTFFLFASPVLLKCKYLREPEQIMDRINQNYPFMSF